MQRCKIEQKSQTKESRSFSLAKSASEVIVKGLSTRNAGLDGVPNDKRSDSGTFFGVNCVALHACESDAILSSETKDHNVSSSQGFVARESDGKKARKQGRTEIKLIPASTIGFGVESVSAVDCNDEVVEPESASSLKVVHLHVLYSDLSLPKHDR